MPPAEQLAITGAQLVDLARYPIADLETSEGARFATRCHQDYVDTGLCMLSDFIRPQRLALLSEEAASVAGQAYFCRDAHTPYLKTANSDLDLDDPVNRMEQTFVGSVAYDLLPPGGPLVSLYNWRPLMKFIAAVLGKPRLYQLADPFGACSINVFVDGGEHGWHFDESEYTVTLMLQAPEQGGVFEYVPLIRGLEDEGTIVDNVLNGDRSRVVELPFTPSTLLIFAGQRTLHRVSKMTGDTPRLVPVLCFTDVPGQTNSEQVRQLFWGRKGPHQTSIV